MSKEASFGCYDCGGQMQLVDGYDGLYQCQRCNTKTHEKVEENIDELRDLAQTDLAIADIVKVLIGDRA